MQRHFRRSISVTCRWERRISCFRQVRGAAAARTLVFSSSRNVNRRNAVVRFREKKRKGRKKEIEGYSPGDRYHFQCQRPTQAESGAPRREPKRDLLLQKKETSRSLNCARAADITGNLRRSNTLGKRSKSISSEAARVDRIVRVSFTNYSNFNRAW